MDVAIVVVWWIALLGALALTVAILGQIVRVVHHAHEIDRLAKVALPAAQGIAANTAAIAELEGVLRTAGRLLAGVEAIAGTAAAIEGRVAALGRALRGVARGGA